MAMRMAGEELGVEMQLDTGIDQSLEADIGSDFDPAPFEDAPTFFDTSNLGGDMGMEAFGEQASVTLFPQEDGMVRAVERNDDDPNLYIGIDEQEPFLRGETGVSHHRYREPIHGTDALISAGQSLTGHQTIDGNPFHPTVSPDAPYAGDVRHIGSKERNYWEGELGLPPRVIDAENERFRQNRANDNFYRGARSTYMPESEARSIYGYNP